jgi:tRNA-specific 2-thiouridylase
MVKPEVRELARSMDLAVASKGDSQEICFVPNGDYAAFMSAYLKDKGIEPQATRGDIVTTDGRTLGEHQGVHHFTVGQRKGLGISSPDPLYVISTDPQTQRVVVGNNDDLLCGRFVVRRVNWISIAGVVEPVRAQVKIRNKHAAADATLQATADPATVDVVFDEPQRAVTPGQGAVFYDGDLVLGGGWIG